MMLQDIYTVQEEDGSASGTGTPARLSINRIMRLSSTKPVANAAHPHLHTPSNLAPNAAQARRQSFARDSANKLYRTSKGMLQVTASHA